VSVGFQPAAIAITPFIDSDSGLATLSGGNSFTGNQTVNGTVSATSFVGSGSGLTNVNAATLGGVMAGNYARLDIGNVFNGNQNMTGNASVSGTFNAGTSVVIGGGTAITEHLSVLLNPAIAALKSGVCSTTSLTLNGASDGDSLVLGVPNARMTGGAGVILNYSAWVSSANKVTLQVCNIGSSPQKTAGSGAIRVDLWEH